MSGEGAAAGRVADLDPAGRIAVLAYRHWCEAGPGAVAAALGAGPGASLSALCALCAGAARRPLVRHAAGCPCLGADEAALAALIAAAAEGAREEAFLQALALVRDDAVPVAVGLAQQAGLCLRRMLLQQGRGRLH